MLPSHSRISAEVMSYDFRYIGQVLVKKNTPLYFRKFL